MIDRGHALSVTKQAEVVGIARSTVYYVPRDVTPEDLTLMKQIDLLHMEFPFAGSRMLRLLLAAKGSKVGRRHVKTLMQCMGIEALYRRPRTTKPAPATRSSPYLLRGLEIVRPNQVWAMDITYIPMAKGFVYLAVVLDWFSRRVLSWRLSITMQASFCVETLEGPGEARQAGDLQHGSGLAVHVPGVHRRAGEARRQEQHGRQRGLARQRVRRAPVAQREIRGSLSARLRESQRGARRDRAIPRPLQSPPTALRA